jgi:hypothetical protein
VFVVERIYGGFASSFSGSRVPVAEPSRFLACIESLKISC